MATPNSTPIYTTLTDVTRVVELIRDIPPPDLRPRGLRLGTESEAAFEYGTNWWRTLRLAEPRYRSAGRF